MKVVEGSILISYGDWEEVPLEEGVNPLRFQLTGAQITKANNELNGKPCIVVKVDNHYEVRRIRRNGDKSESFSS